MGNDIIPQSLSLELCIICLYMCVDLPTIISGDYVGIMDPHENVINNEGKTGKRFPIRDFNRYISQSAPFEGVFGYSNRNNYYNGTLFRFPFRNNKFKSRISDLSLIHI